MLFQFVISYIVYIFVFLQLSYERLMAVHYRVNHIYFDTIYANPAWLQ